MPTRTPIYRSFFLVGIALTLTAGAGWGAYLLLRITNAGDFTRVSVFSVNAHGQAQIYGWVGLFMMGFAYQMFPAFLGGQLPWPKLARASLALMASAVLVRSIAESQHRGLYVEVALAAAMVQWLTVLLFVVQLAETAKRSRKRWGPGDPFIVAAFAWFLLATSLDVRHLAQTLWAGQGPQLLAEIAVWQLPLRDLQIHGLAVSMILGVSMRILPGFFKTKRPNFEGIKKLFWPLQLAVVGEVFFFVLAMMSGKPLAFLLYWLSTVLFAGTVAGVVAQLRPFSGGASWKSVTAPVSLVRAAYLWLVVSLVMLVAAPFWGGVVGRPFSHAWHGATRHAITVGYISLMIVGVASRIVPRPSGSGTRGTRMPWQVFVLLNLGCFLRVSQQVLTDVLPWAFRTTGVSGLLELTGLTWWAIWIVPRLAALTVSQEVPTVPIASR